MYDIIIIGAGPAGLTSALYALRANKKVLVLESKSYGGQIVKANIVENYPGIKSISGFEYAENLFNQVKDLGCEFKFETVLRIDKDKTVITNDNKYKTKAVIIATGVENRRLNINKEVDYIGKGVSYCATCDGNFYKNKDVALVGGGNTALEEALYLSNIVNTVYLIHRNENFDADEKYMEEIKNKSNIKLLLSFTVKNINGENLIESIDIENNKKEIINIKISCLFISIGQSPKNEIFSNVVDLNKLGYIISHDDVYTKTKGIYVAGDTREKKLRQLTTAISDGAIAATVAIKEMEK